MAGLLGGGPVSAALPAPRAPSPPAGQVSLSQALEVVAAPAAKKRRTGGKAVRVVLRLVNVARSIPKKCGKKLMPAVPPVSRNNRLERAAKKYAKTMAREDWFDHDAPDGTGPGERISAEGYEWSAWGENIAAGCGDVGRVVTGWLASPGHCRTLMGPYQHLGFGHAYNKRSTYGHYWVQDFATPR